MGPTPGQDKVPPQLRKRVLVVDDEPMVCDLLTRFLDRQGLTTVTAGDGQEALENFNREAFDLVISDLRMPSMDGLQLLHAIKGINPRVPFIFISGHGDIPTVVEALKAGAENFLPKPLELNILGKVVNQSLRLAAQPPAPSGQLACIRQITLLEAPSGPEYIHDLISQVTSSAICVGYAEVDLDNNLRLALVEALTNAMEHGNRWDESLSVRVEVDLTRDSIKVSIEDQGPGFDPTCLPDPTCGDQLFSERGRGVFLMRAIMDEVCYSPPGNRVVMVKNRRPIGQAPASIV